MGAKAFEFSLRPKAMFERERTRYMGGLAHPLPARGRSCPPVGTREGAHRTE
jgi:hypothetical protein